VGGVYGALLVSFAKTMFAEAYPQLWQFLIGAVFILVVLVLPYGLASIYGRFGHRMRTPFERWLGDRKARSSASSGGFQEPLQEKRP